jgi:RNA polymerase sigma-70 factor (ECF subfamily)
VTTWLHRIVVNACLDRVRRRAARPTTPLPEHDIAGPEVDTDVVLDVQAALQRLPEDQRTAIVLVDMEGFSVADAAEIMNVPTGTVKSRCARGRARLAVMLGHMRNPDGPTGVSSESASTIELGRREAQQ